MDLRVIDPQEEELRRRMALARQQGWNEDEINRSALIERNLNSRRKSAAPAATPQKEVGRREGWDAVGSTILNFLPGGSLLDKALHNESISAGDVGMEALLSAIPFGLGKVARAAKGGAALLKGGAAATRGAEAVTDAAATSKSLPKRTIDLFTKPQEGVVTGGIQTGGSNIRAANRGITPGMRPEGAARSLRPNEADQLNLFLDKSVKAKGSVQKQLRKTSDYQQRASAEIEAAVTKDNRALTTTELQDLTNSIRTRIVGENGTGISGFDPRLHGDIANAYGRQLADIKDARGLLNFKRSLDQDAINYGRSSNAPDPMREQIAQIFRREASNKLNDISPSVKAANAKYGQAEGAINALMKKANPTGYRGGGFTNFNGQGIGGRAIQNLMDKFGRGVQATGRGLSRPIGNQAAIRAGADVFGLRSDPQQAQMSDQGQLPQNPSQLFTGEGSGSPDQAAIDQLMAGGAQDFETLAQGLSGGQQMPGAAGAQGGLQYSSTELFNAAMKALTAGDKAGYKELSDAATMAADFESAAAKQAQSAGGNGLNVTKVTAQQYGLAQSGAQALQQLAQLVQKDPGVITRSATPGRGLPIVGGFISNAAGTGDFDAVGYNIADTILRLRTGATANESEVRNLQSQIMPRAGDSQQTINTKLQQIQSIFSNVLDLAGQPSATSGLPDELMQLFAGQGQQYAY